jgi:hypothetical protein
MLFAVLIFIRTLQVIGDGVVWKSTIEVFQILILIRISLLVIEIQELVDGFSKAILGTRLGTEILLLEDL